MNAAWLVILNRKDAEREFELSPANEMTLGRRTDNGIVLEDDQVSSRHCKIEFADGAWHLSDLDSRNGTRVNDTTVRGRRRLNDGDVITVGATKLRFATGPKAPPTAMSVEPPPQAPAAAVERTVEAPAVVALPVADDGDADAVWFLPGEGDQNAGPFTAAEVTARLKSGQATPATPCWREGMGDWLPLEQVKEFAGAARARKAVPPAMPALRAMPEPPEELPPRPAPDNRQRMIVAGSMAVIVLSLAAVAWALFGFFGSEPSAKFRSKSALAKIAVELEQAVPSIAPARESRRDEPIPAAVKRVPAAETAMVIRLEDFHLDVGLRETWQFQPAGGDAGTMEYALAEKLPSSTATVFRETVKFNGNTLPDMLVSVSEEGVSIMASDLPQTPLLSRWPMPLRMGQRYEYTANAGRIMACVAGPETVTVPAGTFRCLVCVEQVHAQDQQWENRIWFAPKTGVVKMVVGGPKGFESSLVRKEQAAGAGQELVIRKEDFKFAAGFKEVFERVPRDAAGARGHSEYIIHSQSQSGGTTLFPRAARGPDGKTEEQLLTLSQEGLSLYPTPTLTGLPMAHVPLPLRVGQTFDFAILAGRVRARVEGVEEITVPAGTYRCLVFVEQIDMPDRRGEARVWMAPNVGTVKWSMDGPEGCTESLVKQELASPASLFERPIPSASAPALRKSVRGFLRGGVDLLTANDLLSGRVAGQWRRDADGLTVLPERGSQFLQLNLPGEIAGSYDLEVQFTRHSSDQTVGVVLPAGSRLCSVVLSSFAGEASGLEFINEQDVRNNPTTFKPAALNNGQSYTLLVQVRPQGDRVGITATLDGKPFISWSGAQSSLHSYQGSWEAAPNRASLIAYECSVTFHSVMLRTMAR
jgi:predicted component of type VI protein secretion system